MDLYELEEIAMQYCEALRSCEVAVYSTTDVGVYFTSVFYSDYRYYGMCKA